MTRDKAIQLARVVTAHDMLPSLEQTRLLARALLAEVERGAVILAHAKRLATTQLRLPDVNGDWACVECRPHSDCIKAGFQCAAHVIAALAAEQGE